MKGSPLNKTEARLELKKKRKALSFKRREEAADALFHTLIPILAPYPKILSFASFPDEIDTTLLNQFLATTGRLLLPESLKEKNEIALILVPGLGFTASNYRIGYGKGYYDRLLASLPHCPSFGLGFKEQLVESLPIESTDYPVSHLYLF